MRELTIQDLTLTDQIAGVEKLENVRPDRLTLGPIFAGLDNEGPNIHP